MATDLNISATTNEAIAPPPLSDGHAPATGGGASAADRYSASPAPSLFDQVAASRPIESAIAERFAGRFGELASDRDAFHELLGTVYGENYDRGAAEGLRQRALAGDTSWLPEIELHSAATLDGAHGAYDAERDVVYLNRDLASNLSAAADVYAEEVGHALDRRLVGSDTRGDEGELFRRLLGGEELSARQVESIRAENDHGVIRVGDRDVEVEFFNPFKSIKNAVSRLSWSDIGHGALDVLGFVPGVGEFADAANAAWYAAEGKYLDAGLSLLSMIPGVGDVIGKGGRYIAKLGPDGASKILKALDGVDVVGFLDKFKDTPGVGKYIGKIQEAVRKWMDDLRIRPTGDIDPAADALAKRLDGQASVRIEGFGNREFDAISDRFVAQIMDSTSAITKPHNFLSKSRRTQIRETLRAANELGREALFEFSAGKPHQDVIDFIQRNAERVGATVKIEYP